MTVPAYARDRQALLRRLAPILHPRWCPADDHALMTAREGGAHFTAIAAMLGRSRIAVEQRWHRLRAVPGILDLLEEHGLSRRPWRMGGEDG
jgi:hypothetical protein